MMYRIISLCLLIMILVVGFGSAEKSEDLNFDFSNMSLDYLLDVKKEIDSELASRNGIPILHSGNYIVGRDIASGRYVITDHAKNENYSNAWTIRTCKSETSVSDYNLARMEYDAAFEMADLNRESGEEYSYPEQVNRLEYFEDRSLASNSTISIFLEEGQMLSVYRNYSKEGVLTIEQATGLFMD